MGIRASAIHHSRFPASLPRRQQMKSPPSATAIMVIPIADALSTVLAEQSAEAERAARVWQQQEAKLRAELFEAVNQRERELSEAHELELSRLRQNNEKVVQAQEREELIQVTNVGPPRVLGLQGAEI